MLVTYRIPSDKQPVHAADLSREFGISDTDVLAWVSDDDVAPYGIHLARGRRLRCERVSDPQRLLHWRSDS